MKFIKYRMILLSTLLAVHSILCCGSLTPPVRQITASTAGYNSGSTTAGNLIATAIREENDLDMVFYPSSYLKDNVSTTIQTNMSDTDISSAVALMYDFTSGETYPKKQFMTGTIKGSAIRQFVLDRCMENSTAFFQTAGIIYDITIVGGICTEYSIKLENGQPLDDDTNYKIAVDTDNFWWFPGYRWRNSFESDLYKSTSDDIDASTAITNYLKKVTDLAAITSFRGKVRNMLLGTVPGNTPIYTIQGRSFLSPYRGMTVTTTGIVTGSGTDDRGNKLFYLQDQTGDGDDVTSDAIFCFMPKGSWETKSTFYTIGNKMTLTGLVSEDYTSEKLTRTSLRMIDVNSISIAGKYSRPAPVIIGTGGRIPPSGKISNYNGNLNLKPELILSDGVDFWESLEGMWISVSNPTVTGTKGGLTDKNDPSNYINVSILPDGCGLTENFTYNSSGKQLGIIIDAEKNEYNPPVITMVDNDLLQTVSSQAVWKLGGSLTAASGNSISVSSTKYSSVFNVGDKFTSAYTGSSTYNADGHINGILTYEMDNFGGGEYVMYPELVFGSGTSKLKDTLSAKDQTTLVSDTSHLTVGSYNCLFRGKGDAVTELQDIAESIVTNLKCPDILCLVEIPDNDGPIFGGSSAADQVLKNLIADIESLNPSASDYTPLNIDPILNAEGGAPGGNIRVAYLYRSSRVGFEARNKSDGTPAGTLDENYVRADGSLAYNPGRIGVNEPSFKGCRRSLAAQFTFNGQTITIIGNHLKSKIGDGSLWGDEQPVKLNSEAKRTEEAAFINNFVTQILNRNPNANVIVAGDFNEFYAARPLRVLQGNILNELMETLLPFNKRYTYNYGGNAQDIDHIYVTKTMMQFNPEVSIPHFNSQYMYHVSDHDPVIARFTIPAAQ